MFLPFVVAKEHIQPEKVAMLIMADICMAQSLPQDVAGGQARRTRPYYFNIELKAKPETSCVDYYCTHNPFPQQTRIQYNYQDSGVGV